MDFLLDKVEERDMDFVIMRAFAELPDFPSLFLNKIGRPMGDVLSVGHSLMDNELGESDIVIILSLAGRRFALLIENKINALAMPEQCQRYSQRGARGRTEGLYDDFAVFIIAPRAYLESNEEAQKYANRISYEDLLAFFSAANREMDCQITNAAITKQIRGYTVQEVPAMTDFWKNLYAYCCSSGYAIEMYPTVGPKGPRSTWPQFKSALKGTELFYKANQGVCDLQFVGKLHDHKRLNSALSPLKDEDMHWAEAGKSLALRIKVAPMDFKKPFHNYLRELNLMVDAIERLTKLSFALNDTGFVV